MTQLTIDNRNLEKDQDSSIVLSPDSGDVGVRLDTYLASRIEGWSRARLQRLITDGDVLVNEKTVKASYKLHEGDEIDVDLVEAPTAVFEPENIPLDIVFEDEYLAVINKPAGMVVHPGAGNSSGTLANAIAFHFSSPPRRGDAEAEPPALAGGGISMQKPTREQGRDNQLESYALPNGRASASTERGDAEAEPPALAGGEASMQKPAREQGRNNQLESYALPNGRASASTDRGDAEAEPPALAGGEASMQKPAREQGRNNQLESYALPNGRASASTERVGIVHRLDKDTSGLIVVAKDEETHELLSNQFRDRVVTKQYVTLVHGSPRENTGTIDRPMARDRWHRTKMTVAANGRNALTIWKVRQRFEKFTLVEVEIKTGRTHQIRVHLASINHPVVGDATYNEGRDNTVANIDIKNAIRILDRFFLHAEKLSFDHPKTGEHLSFTSELPPELKNFVELLLKAETRPVGSVFSLVE